MESDQFGRAQAAPGTAAGYVERLRVPWWAWIVAMGITVLVAAEIHLGYGGLRAWLPYVVSPLVVAAALWWLGRVRVAVSEAEFRVDDAHIPVSLLSAAAPLDSAAKHRALGRDLDPLAFVVHRPWIRGAVMVWVDDPADPTPYWVISARRPERVVAALGLPVRRP